MYLVRMMLEVSEQSRGQLYKHTKCCCHCCCSVYAILPLLQQRCCLLLFVIVCRMVKFVAGSLNLIPAFPLIIQTRDIFLVPLGSVVAFTGLDLPTYLVITGMRGAKAGVSPPRRIPPCKCNYRYVGHYVGYVVSAIEKSDLDQVLRRRRPSSR